MSGFGSQMTPEWGKMPEVCPRCTNLGPDISKSPTPVDAQAAGWLQDRFFNDFGFILKAVLEQFWLIFRICFRYLCLVSMLVWILSDFGSNFDDFWETELGWGSEPWFPGIWCFAKARATFSRFGGWPRRLKFRVFARVFEDVFLVRFLMFFQLSWASFWSSFLQLFGDVFWLFFWEGLVGGIFAPDGADRCRNGPRHLSAFSREVGFGVLKP